DERRLRQQREPARRRRARSAARHSRRLEQPSNHLVARRRHDLVPGRHRPRRHRTEAEGPGQPPRPFRPDEASSQPDARTRRKCARLHVAMPTPPYAKLRVALNGGGPQTGGIVANNEDSVQLSLESTVGVTKARWEIYE